MGNNSGFGGTINVYGGKLAMTLNPGDTDDNGFGGSRGNMVIGPNGAIELRGSTTTTEENGMGQPITLYGTIRADYQTTFAITSVPRVSGPITISWDTVPLNIPGGTGCSYQCLL